MTKKNYHVVTFVSKYPIKATSDTVSVDPRLLFQQLLLLGTDVLKYELCVYPPALFEAAGTMMLQSDKPSQANAIQEWIHPSSIQIPQYVSYIYVGGALINKKIPWKTGQTCESLCLKYTEYVKKIGPTKLLFVWWLLRWSFYKKQFSSEMEEIIWQ